MTNILRPFADITDVVINLLVRDFAELDEANAGTDLNDVAANLPYLLVTFIGGQGDRLSRVSSVEVEIFAGTYAQAVSLSERISAHLLGYPHSVEVDGRLVVLDMVLETRPPVELPWDDSNTRRFASTYQISVRR